MIKPRHGWDESDDLVAFYLWRYGNRRLPLMDAAIAKRLGIPEGSLARRQANFKHLEDGRGLPHVANQSRRIYERYRFATEPELRPVVLQAIDRSA